MASQSPSSTDYIFRFRFNTKLYLLTVIRARYGTPVIDILATALATCLCGTLRRIDQSQVQDFNSRPLQTRAQLRDIPFKPVAKSRELRPVGVKADPAQAYTQFPAHHVTTVTAKGSNSSFPPVRVMPRAALSPDSRSTVNTVAFAASGSGTSKERLRLLTSSNL